MILLHLRSDEFFFYLLFPLFLEFYRGIQHSERVKSPLFLVKLLIEEAVRRKIITQKGRKYFLDGGEGLCNKGEINNLDNAAKFLKDDANQDILISIKGRLDAAKE